MHHNVMLHTHFTQGVSAAFVEAHGVHGLAGGCFDAHVFPFRRQKVYKNLLHVMLVKVFPIVSCTQEKTYIDNYMNIALIKWSNQGWY